MQSPLPTSTELDAAVLQAAVTLGFALYAAFLYRRYRKPYFGWFSATWLLYYIRICAISAYFLTQHSVWLYWHQVLTGWTALALLWTALVFYRQLAFRPIYLVALLFPLGWSYAAIYMMHDFLRAALPAVLFLSLVTAVTAGIFYLHWRRIRAPGAALLALGLFLWSLHHLDYPFLRARGAWSPWGYYLDIAFLLTVNAGMTVLVLDDLREGFSALTSLAGGVRGASGNAVLDALLARAVTLPAARGAAFFVVRDGEARFLRGAGVCASWTAESLTPTLAERISGAIRDGRPVVVNDRDGTNSHASARFAYSAVLPVATDAAPDGVLVIVGEARDPFAALDEEFLVALGRQIGGALRSAALTESLRERSDELARLSSAMIRQHEEERRRLSRELHDETAQVFSAVKLQLGMLQERATGEDAEGLGRALQLVDTGIRSIREVTETLRPTVLDELGLVAALRSLAADVSSRGGLQIAVEAPATLPGLSQDAELALFRAMQESLSNIMRHAGARQVRVLLERDECVVRLEVRDDGRGLDGSDRLARAEREGRMGMAGMRERVVALGGQLVVEPAEPTGTVVRVVLPMEASA